MGRTARFCIRELDRELARTGEFLKIARLTDAPEGEQEPFYCERIPAKVKFVQPQEIISIGKGGAVQETLIVISPTRLSRRQWPAPPRKDDRIWITDASGNEIPGNIESITELHVQSTVVRYNLMCRS